MAGLTSDLRAMVQAGLLVQRGQERGTSYSASTPLATVRLELMATRKPIDVSTPF